MFCIGFLNIQDRESRTIKNTTSCAVFSQKIINYRRVQIEI